MQLTCIVVNTHLNHRGIFLFSTPCSVGLLLCMRNINCKPHWLAICCLSRIYYFFSIDSSELENNMMNIVCQSWNNNLCTWENAFSMHYIHKILIHHLSIGGWFKRMELIEVKKFNLGAKGETLYNLCKCDVNLVANHPSLVAKEKVLFWYA